MKTESSETRRPKSLFLAAREVLLIVIGVLLALWLESVWEDRSDRVAEKELLTGLGEEFQRNSQDLTRWQGLHQHVISSAEGFIALLESQPLGQEVSVPDSLIADVIRDPTYEPELNSLQAAVNSGRIALIRSTEIQQALASWARLLADAQEEEQKGSDLVYRDLLPHLRRITDLGPTIKWRTRDAQLLMRGLPAEPQPNSSSVVVVSKELTNLMWIRYRLASAAANELDILRGELNRVLSLLEAEVD